MEITWGYLFLDTVASEAAEAWVFWQAATGSRRSDVRGEHGEFATLVPAEGDAWLKVQSVGAPGGVHLDLHVTDRAGAVAEAEGLGARVRRELDDVTVMASPGGFGFCLVGEVAGGGAGGAGSPGAARTQVRPERGTLLDQLCIDVPSDLWDTERGFWSALTGWERRAGSLPEFTSLLRPEGFPVRILMQRLEEPEGVVRGHVDFACSDVTAAVLEHQALGSRPVGGGRFWTVMEHPSGAVYCLTPREPATGLPPGR